MTTAGMLEELAALQRRNGIARWPEARAIACERMRQNLTARGKRIEGCNTIDDLQSKVGLTPCWSCGATPPRARLTWTQDNYYMRDNLGVLSDDIAFAKGEAKANRILYERTANERDALNRDLAGTRETLLSVGNISEERQQWIQAYSRQQRVSDGNIQRLEAERDEAVQLKDFWLQSAFLAETKIADANAALRTQRRHNDTLNTVQARLMRERDEAVADWVQ